MDVVNTEPVIDIHDLHMRYGTRDVLQGVDIQVYRGEVLALLGPNGAGKTTTIEILEGFRKRSAGEVRVLGTDPNFGTEQWRARLGIVLQAWRDHGKWRVRDLLHNLGHYYMPYSTPERSRPYDTDELLSLVGLAEHANAIVGKLSGGQRRRLDVAIGLVGRPELLFLDEPTVGFDPEARQEFHELIQRLADLEETTILLTTHDLAEAEKLAHRILILAGGKIVANGTPAELAEQTAGKARVRYRKDGEQHVHFAENATDFVYDLFAQYGKAISHLEVHQASLEDTYLTMVREFESGQRTTAPTDLTEVTA